MASSVAVMDWDDEAQNEALAQARRMSTRDPEAASLLVATLVVTQDAIEERGEVTDRSPNDYEPVKMYDFLCREYGWRPRDIDEMHYITVFALLEAANERHRREQEENEAAMKR